MKIGDITIPHIKEYIEGNMRLLYSSFIMLDESLQEQIIYRKLCCPDCTTEGRCQKCGCSLPGKWYATKSCNDGERFPDLMNEKEWEKFKLKNNIIIEL